MNKLLVDTNILIYAIDEDSQFFSKARNVIENSGYSLLTTSKNLSEFLAVVTKASAYNLDTQLALEILGEIIQGMEVNYPNQESMKIFLDLINQYQPKGLKIHDFEIMSIGLANGCSHFATFNSKDFMAVKSISVVDI